MYGLETVAVTKKQVYITDGSCRDEDVEVCYGSDKKK